jgi:hypothetical protein
LPSPTPMVGAKTPYALLLSFVVGNHNLQEKRKYHGYVFTKY